jgi:prevent-host-death family protein
MPDSLPKLEDLPRRNATQVKNQWSDLVREVRARGSVAVTHHDRVEMVVVDATKYREMAALVQDAVTRQQEALADLSAEFDRRLAALKAPDTRRRMTAAMASRGQLKVRPKAGDSF